MTQLTDPNDDARAVKCPHCGAANGAKCITNADSEKTSEVRDTVHRARYKAAKEAGEIIETENTPADALNARLNA